MKLNCTTTEGTEERMEQDEQEYARRVHRDRDSFLQLYRLYFARVYNYTFYRCFDQDASEDLTSAIFETALERISSYNYARAPFGAWLFGIARNILSKYLRSSQKRSPISLDDISDHVGTEVSPEQAFLQKEREQELSVLLAKLKEREQDLISLKFGARLNNRQIAKLVGMSESNVGVCIYRALKKMRQSIGERVGKDE
jgi:RNA polymerase sigma factor (sigma-70 family)